MRSEGMAEGRSEHTRVVCVCLSVYVRECLVFVTPVLVRVLTIVSLSVGAQDPVKAKLRERVIESRRAVHKETTAQVDKRKDFEAAVSDSIKQSSVQV